MITAKEARARTERAKKTGEFAEYKKLQSILESLESRIIETADNGHNTIMFRLHGMDFLSIEQIRNFIKQYYSKSEFTVKFSEKISLVFWLCW